MKLWTMPSRELDVGQTWRLPDGDIVTLVELPAVALGGWIKAVSLVDGRERSLGEYPFGQPTSELLESREPDPVALLREAIRVLLVRAKRRWHAG